MAFFPHVRLRANVDLEVTMADKPKWIRDIEEKRTRKRLDEETKAQSEANTKRLLAMDAPKVWARLASCLETSAQSISLEGVVVTVNKRDDFPNQRVDVQITTSSTFRGQPEGVIVRCICLPLELAA